jgi:FKBP-type peptidyl-prolyl cis-trans isomerase
MPDFYRTTSKMQVAVGIILASFLMACKPPVQELTESQPDLVSEELVKANQYMHQRHQDHMAAFVERVGWKANVTPTGLWIIHDIQGNGSPIVENSRVTFSFESTLLDGTPCYMASANKPKVITIGKGGVESGVEQGMTLLREGSEAVFLIPPHLGHGNFGDRDRIPGNSVLIYSLKVMKVE